MGKEDQNSLGSEFSVTSQRMTGAWKKMIASGQISVYFGMSTEALAELGERIERDKRPAEGKEHIAEYLGALSDLIALRKKDESKTNPLC